MSKLVIHPNDRVVINLNIDQMVTILGGDSGTGKQFIQNQILDIQAQQADQKVSGYDINNIEIIQDNRLVEHIDQLGLIDKLVIVDRVDTLQAIEMDKLVSEINKCKNTWILMKRLPDTATSRTTNKLSSDVNFTRYGYKQLSINKSNDETVISDVLE